MQFFKSHAAYNLPNIEEFLTNKDDIMFESLLQHCITVFYMISGAIIHITNKCFPNEIKKKNNAAF